MKYLTLQTTYTTLNIGLFNDNLLIDEISEDKKKASTNIVLHIDTLLRKNDITLKDLECIVVNQGPAPFTSLRVIIATVNGISFATGLPLVGVDALEVFTYEHTDPAWPSTVALLNAFNNDVYYAIQQPEKILEKGCTSIEDFLQKLKESHNAPNQIRFIGNGIELFKDLIVKAFPNAYFPDPLPEYPSLYRIGLAGLHNWHTKEHITNQILPLYLKQVRYKKSILV